MESKMIVYYGTDLLPYKDKELQVHYPIVGSAFQGASQTTCIRFYITNIIRQDSDIWLVVAKLPNGQVGYTRVEVVEENGESYFDFYLTRWHTQYKGDLYLNLQCYDGGVDFEYDDETELYLPSGVPVVQVSGSVKLAINYATGIIDNGDLQEHTLQEILAYISNKLDRDSNKYIKVITSITQLNTLAYKDYIKSGDIVFSKANNTFYLVSGEYPTMSATFSLDFNFFNLAVANNLYIGDFEDIIDSNDDTLVDFVDAKVVDKVPQANSDLTFAQYITNYGVNKVICVYYGHETLFIRFQVDEDDNEKCYVYISSSSGTLVAHDLKTKTLQSTLTFVYVEKNNNFINVSSTSGTLTANQLLQLKNNNAYIVLSQNGYGLIYHLVINQETDTGIASFERTNIGASSGVITFTKEIIQVNKATGSYQLTTTANTTYTKDQIDTLFSSTLVYKGSLSVSELNALDKTTLKTGWFYNVSDKGTLTWTESGVSKSLEVLEGDNIAWTGSGWDKMTMDLTAYDDKFISAGFFEVQDYDEENGTITLVYASDLYTMSYDDDSGVLTIQAN